MDSESNARLDDLTKNIERNIKVSGFVEKPIPDGINCTTCQNKGHVLVTEDGYTRAEPCPKCSSQRATKRRLKASLGNAGRYEGYTLDTFNADTPSHKRMKDKAVEYVEKYDGKKSFGVFGKSGTGKTHLCIAVGRAILERHNKAFYYFEYRQEMPKLKTQMLSFNGNEEFNESMRKLKTVDNLYIDDAFKLFESGNRVDNKELEIMFELINGRYLQNKATLFSSEYSVKELLQIDAALGSRIFEMCDPYGVLADGENVRLKRG